MISILVIPHTRYIGFERPCEGKKDSESAYIASLSYVYRSFSDCGGLNNYHIIFPRGFKINATYEWMGGISTFTINDWRKVDYDFPISLPDLRDRTEKSRLVYLQWCDDEYVERIYLNATCDDIIK